MAIASAVPGWINRVTVKKKLTAQELKEVTLYFNNLVLFNLLKLNYTQFLKKAKGGEDDYGEQWLPLNPKTVKWKRKKKILYNGKVAINIRTRALLNALKPNQFANGVYIAGPNQIVKVTTKSIYFSVEIEHADAVDKIRPIFVTDLDAMLDTAVSKSIARLQSYIRSRKL